MMPKVFQLSVLASFILICSARPLPAILLGRLPTDLQTRVPAPEILDEQGLDDYVTSRGGSIGFYGSCKGESSGACRYPLECFANEREPSDDNPEDLLVSTNGTCVSSSPSCMCQLATVFSKRCKRSSNCDKNDRCASFLSMKDSYCVSCSVKRADVPHISGFVDRAKWNCGTNSEEGEIKGREFDNCRKDDECDKTDGYTCGEYPVFSSAKYRYCVNSSDNATGCSVFNAMNLFQRCNIAHSENGTEASNASTGHKNSPCVCRRESSLTVLYGCEKSSHCNAGERCMKHKGFVNSSFTSVCLSCNPPNLWTFQNLEPIDDGMGKCTNGFTSPIPSIVPEEVETPEPSAAPCIAVQALGEFQSHELVFEKHIRASVLCDHWNNCATSGHIVVFKGVGMMMSSYCTIVDEGCKKRAMFVNSPRMGRRVRVK